MALRVVIHQANFNFSKADGGFRQSLTVSLQRNLPFDALTIQNKTVLSSKHYFLVQYNPDLVVGSEFYYIFTVQKGYDCVTTKLKVLNSLISSVPLES